MFPPEDDLDQNTFSLTVLSEYFYPEEASTAQLLTQLSESLSKFGDIDVITSYPNYHEIDMEKPPKREEHNGVSIRRVRGTRFNKDSLPLRIINWITFTFLVSWRLIRDKRSDDLLLVLSNPPILPFAAWFTKRIRGTRYVYLIHDVYPDMPIELGIISENRVIARIWGWGMKKIYSDADRIVVLGDSMKQTIEEKMENKSGFDPEKIVVIPNWEDEDFIVPKEKQENSFAQEQGTTEKFTLLYSGNIGRFHDLETPVDAIHELEKKGRSDIQLLIIGEGAKKESLKKRVSDKDIENVKFLPFQPLERLPDTLTCGDASLVTVESGVEGLCVSSKLYSSLASGQPILALVGEDDEVARVVDEYECGERIDQGDTQKVADVLEKWADNPELVEELGENARECLVNNYTREHAVKKYRELFSELSSEV